MGHDKAGFISAYLILELLSTFDQNFKDLVKGSEDKRFRKDYVCIIQPRALTTAGENSVRLLMSHL